MAKLGYDFGFLFSSKLHLPPIWLSRSPSVPFYLDRLYLIVNLIFFCLIRQARTKDTEVAYVQNVGTGLIFISVY
jgi:hypothetical protein